VILLHNRDRYERTVWVAIPGLTGVWEPTDALRDRQSKTLTGPELSQQGVAIELPASGPAVLLVERPLSGRHDGSP
jgi:hypothetical protein